MQKITTLMTLQSHEIVLYNGCPPSVGDRSIAARRG